MRISSRGTVSMGPLGWLLAAPFIAAAFIVYWLVCGLVMLCLVLLRWAGSRR